MKKFDKQDRKVLRELRAKAYSIELDRALTTLASSFDAWRDKRIDGHELSHVIHEFHDLEARRLYGIYDQLDEELAVASAIARGVLNREEVPDRLLAELERAIDVFVDNARQ
jgi:hypothetical protein